MDDIFRSSPETGHFDSKPAALTECLVFVTVSTNIKKMGTKLVMGNHKKKHVGILTKGKVWNYNNTSNKVLAEDFAAFKTYYTNRYKTIGATVEFYFGKFI